MNEEQSSLSRALTSIFRNEITEITALQRSLDLSAAALFKLFSFSLSYFMGMKAQTICFPLSLSRFRFNIRLFLF